MARAAVQRAYRMGHAPRRIARAFGVSLASVYRIARELDVTAPSPRLEGPR